MGVRPLRQNPGDADVAAVDVGQRAQVGDRLVEVGQNLGVGRVHSRLRSLDWGPVAVVPVEHVGDAGHEAFAGHAVHGVEAVLHRAVPLMEHEHGRMPAGRIGARRPHPHPTVESPLLSHHPSLSPSVARAG